MRKGLGIGRRGSNRQALHDPNACARHGCAATAGHQYKEEDNENCTEESCWSSHTSSLSRRQRSQRAEAYLSMALQRMVTPGINGIQQTFACGLLTFRGPSPEQSAGITRVDAFGSQFISALARKSICWFSCKRPKRGLGVVDVIYGGSTPRQLQVARS